MKNKAFGEITFNVGWKTTTLITLFSRESQIVVKAKAYRKTDVVTAEQEKSFTDYSKNKSEYRTTIEKLLSDYSDDAANRFIPKTLLFERDGAWALLCDDLLDPDGGIAVCLQPDKKIVLQDDYL